MDMNLKFGMVVVESYLQYMFLTLTSWARSLFKILQLTIWS